MKVKKLTAGIVAAVMAVTAVGTPLCDSLPIISDRVTTVASAETYEDFEYEVLDDGTVEIKGYNGTGGDVDIPSEIDGKKVKRIGEYAFDSDQSIESIVIPDSVESIELYAFLRCKNLTSITIPDSVISIGDDAFNECVSLKSIKIPDSVISIGYSAFDECKSLTAIDVDESNTIYSSIDGVLFNKVKTELICYPAGKTDKSYIIPDSVTSIDESAFEYCSNITDVTIPSGVTSIERSTFYECVNLESVTIPDGVTSVAEYAFGICKSLICITIPDSVTSIGWSAFIGCASLTSITIPDSVTNIGEGAFENCSSLAAIDVATENSEYVSVNGILYNKDKTVIICYPAGKKDKNYTINDGVTSIEESAFSGCENLTSVVIPDSMVSIGVNAFYGCTSLKAVTIPASVMSIGGEAFGYYLEPVDEVSSLVKKVDGFKINYVKNTQGHWYATKNGFSDEPCVVTRELDDGTLEIVDYAGNDTTYVVPPEINGQTVTQIGDRAFFGNKNLIDVTISDGVTFIGTDAFRYCDSLKSITIPSSVTVLSDGAFESCTNLTNIIIPDSVTSIGDNVFHECRSLTNMTIPYGVTSIGENVFCVCVSLTRVTIPDSVTSIGEWAFGACCSLIDITIPDSVTSIEQYAFAQCESLTSITIPDSVTSIGNTAFYNCMGVTSITIPNSVISIGDSAFGYYSDDNFDTRKIDNFKINCYSGTAGEQYAKDNEFDYEILDCDTHQYGDWIINPAATCTTEGKEKHTCAVCGRTEKQIIPATGHNFVDGICKNCNKTEAETIQSKHPYDDDCDETWTIYRENAKWIAVTFTEDTYTESEFDYIYIYDGNDEQIGSYSGDELSGKTITVNSDTVKIRLTSDSSGAEYGFALDKIEYSTEALCDHSNTEIRNAVSAGCTTEGYTGDTYCVDCDELISSGEVIPATGHTEVVDKAVEATCTEIGFTEGSHCSVCNEIIREQLAIPPKGHTEVIDKAVAATCTKTGLTEGIHCSVCNTVIKAQEVIPAKGHTEVIDKAVEATCTKTGLTEGKHCSVCNTVIKAQEVVPAKGHTEVTDKAVAATCTKTGLTEGSHCSVCDAVIKAQEVVPAKGHTEVVDKAVEATCTKTGLTEGIHCSVCGTVIKAQEVVPATGKHSFGNWKITKAATCTATGTKTRTCSGCGKVETQTIAKTAHKYVNTVVRSTYTAQGYTLHKCSVCGTSYKDTYTAKLTLAKVTGVKLGGRAADALRINWSKNANADGYIVEMYQGNKWVRVAKITSNSTTTFRKAGLKAGTAYKFRVRAYKMEGKTAVYGAYSATVAARTNPSVIKGAKLTGRAADALRINWTKNTTADGYIVEMYKGGKWVRAAKITSNSTTTFRKAGLKASTVYKFRVRAYKMSGKTALYGNYSATVTARTNPSIVKGVKIAGKAKDALRVNWAKNASAQGYIVEMYKGGKWVRVAKITNGNTTTFRKAGLAKNTAYKFRVRAYHMSGKTALYGNYGSVSGKTAAK